MSTIRELPDGTTITLASAVTGRQWDTPSRRRKHRVAHDRIRWERAA